MRKPRKIKALPILTVAIVLLFSLSSTAGFADFFSIPPLPPPEIYGNILINRTSEANGMRPVSFSHWSHRLKYTCRVCHTELEFNFQVNTTEITEEANRKGRYCGACHNGKDAFGHTKENCDKCHNGDLYYNKDKFGELKDLPQRGFGNGVDWVAALESGAIKPRNSLRGDYRPMPYGKKLVLPVAWGMIPPVVFPHKAHTEWLDCSNCHPDIFNIKVRTTKHFSMARNLKGEFCGVCHMGPAFSLKDCRRCHPS